MLQTEVTLDAQWITLIIVVVGFAFQYFTASRQRKWDLQDRAEARGKVAVETAAMAEAIKENTVITTQAATEACKAYKEANNVNVKIEEVNKDVKKLAEQSAASNADRKGEIQELKATVADDSTPEHDRRSGDE